MTEKPVPTKKFSINSTTPKSRDQIMFENCFSKKKKSGTETYKLLDNVDNETSPDQSKVD